MCIISSFVINWQVFTQNGLVLFRGTGNETLSALSSAAFMKKPVPTNWCTLNLWMFKRMLSPNGYPNNFLCSWIQQFLNKKHAVTRQRLSPAISSRVTWLPMLRATTPLPKQPNTFFIFLSALLLTDNKNLQQDHCSSVCKCTDDGGRSCRNVCKNVLYIVFFGRYFHYNNIKHQKYQVSQFDDCVLTCWIEKGLG